MKKLLILISGAILIVASFNSCKKTSNSPLIGNWSKVVIATDTAYLKISDNSNFTFGAAVNGLPYAQYAAGTYTYTGSQFTFTVQTAYQGSYNCVGAPGTYTYNISGSSLI